MKIALFSFVDTVDELIDVATTANNQGFESLWLPQVFGLDTLTAVAIAGQKVPDITFTTAVVPTYPRHPQMLAQQALTVNAAIGGRLVLAHKPVVEGSWGISFDKPIRHLREVSAFVVGSSWSELFSLVRSSFDGIECSPT